MEYGFGAFIPKVFHKPQLGMLANHSLRGDTRDCALHRSSLNQHRDHHYLLGVRHSTYAQAALKGGFFNPREKTKTLKRENT